MDILKTIGWSSQIELSSQIYGDTTSLQSIHFLLDTNELVAIVYLNNFPLI